MSVMVVGGDRACFAQAERTEFFDIFYCLPDERLPGHGPAGAAVRAAQLFIVDGLAPLFPFWKQPVSDHVAIAALAFVLAKSPEVGSEEVGQVGDFVAALGANYRVTIDELVRVFRPVLRSPDPSEAEQLFAALLLDLLVDPAHLPAHGARIDALLAAAVRGLRGVALAGCPTPARHFARAS